MTSTATGLTEQQLDLYEALIQRTTPLGAATASPGMAAALLDEIRRLRAELASRNTVPAGGVSMPQPSLAYEQMERRRTELDKGLTDQEWAVGRIVCPEGFSCVSHPLTLFVPTKRGRLPVHRHQTFHTVCKGSGQKPTTPPLQLRSAVSSG